MFFNAIKNNELIEKQNHTNTKGMVLFFTVSAIYNTIREVGSSFLPPTCCLLVLPTGMKSSFGVAVIKGI